MSTAYKAVLADYSSSFRSGDSYVGSYASLFSDASWPATDWDSLALDYTVGNTVTPDPDLETAVKLSSPLPLMREHVSPWTLQPNGSNGLYAWIDRPGFTSGRAFHLARYTARRMRKCHLPDPAFPDEPFCDPDDPDDFDIRLVPFGRVLLVDYEESDVLGELVCFGTDSTVLTLQLRSCTVAEEVAFDWAGE